jgi:UPF0042 nucleotide-binding protein
MKDDRFLIITGLSGSGKTSVSRFLEDLGYYCIDNLPAKLIPSLVDLWSRKEVEIAKAALVVDMREAGFTKKFPEVLAAIKKRINLTLIFLDASDEILIKRFSESRRPHPMSKGKSIAEGIKLERKSLSEIKKMADEVIDTSATSISRLREILSERFGRKRGLRPRVVIISFGYKYGIPLDSDLVLDMRFLPNPFYIDNLREKTGKSKLIKEFIFQHDDTKKFITELYRFIDYLMPLFRKEGKSSLTIALGCTGGKHRSVVLADELKNHLSGQNFKVRVHHRDIYK